MKFNKLNFKIGVIIATVTTVIFGAACNNDEGSANNSPAADSTSTATSVAVTPVKKKGKVSAALEADDEVVKMKMDKMGYYNRTEMAPAYPGGQNSLEDYINGQIQYPQEAIDNNTEGTVYVQFGVDEKGNVSNVSTVGSKIGYGLEDEAKRVVSQMPKWTPGQVKGKSVKTWRTLPITYKLES